MAHIITHPRHQQMLQREFGIRGSVVAPNLESTIQPVVVVAQPSSDEFSAAQENKRYGAVFDFTSDATHIAQLTLAPNTGAGVIVIVRELGLLGQNTAYCTYGTTAAQLAAGTPFLGSLMNRRLVANPAAPPLSTATATQFTVTATAAFSSALCLLDFTAGAQEFIVSRPNLVLNPNTAEVFLVANKPGVGAYHMTGYLWWDEIPLTGER